MKSTRQLFYLSLALSCLLMPLFSVASPPDKGLGVNLTHLKSYSSSIPFVDAFKKARPWFSTSDPGELNITSDGWIASLQPGQVARTMIFNNVNGNYPTGVYNIFYQGEGELKLGGGATAISRGKGHIKARVVSHKGGIKIQIRRTNPKNPIKNIRVILPGYEDSYLERPFYPPFIEYIQKFKVVRFMDWMQTNGSKVSTWDERTKKNHAVQTQKSGVAPEWIISLANTAKVNPWITIPHRADDNYVKELAKLFKQNLDPQLKVYLEYSNEVWNSTFPQSKYAKSHGRALSVKKKYSHLAFYSKRSVEVFDIWSEVFEGNNRLVRILAGQSSNAHSGEMILKYGDAYKKADAYAVAPYISLGRDFDRNNVDPDYLLSILNKRLETFVREKIKGSAKMATNYGLPIIAYEGGQHVEGRAKSGKFRCTAVNRHPGMEQLYTEYLETWNSESENGLFVHFNDASTPSQWGCWGMKEWLEQPVEQAPKFRAILRLME